MRLPKHSTLAAYAALFVALGGTSYAATELAPNSVGSTQIRNGSVTRSDLARSARPATKAKLAQAITDVVTDPSTGLNITVHGEKGDKGDAGSQGGAGDTGARGSQGSTGATGPRGASLGFAHVAANGAKDSARTSSNAVVDKPGSTTGLYCVKATDATVRNAAIALDANDALDATAYSRVPPGGDACDGYDLEVITVHPNGSGGFAPVDHGFFITLN